MISWINSIEEALTSLIPIQLDPMAEATGMNFVFFSLEPALVGGIHHLERRHLKPYPGFLAKPHQIT
ncbi:hypothetical protein DSO57_1039240 [Entomophthora muscae]|uniref:Uncharacterized protein n=1 Tax=Entomophthora muscae TaxID=34485 RepID=A0ACC2RD76_9FUNG|nr:hypothetical protein DSO57_1039240 [Entomophthora muscae]